jgi:hypothetical protein
MKTEKFNKKLSFNKLTVANLGNSEMVKIKGEGTADSCLFSICPQPASCITCQWWGCNTELDHSCPNNCPE